MTDMDILATIVIERAEIVRHAKDALYLRARAKAQNSERPERNDALLMDIFEPTAHGEGGDELPTRRMGLIVSEVRHLLGELSGDALTVDAAASDHLRRPEAYTLELKGEPEAWRMGDVDLLAQTLHYLIVARLAAAWCMLISPDDAQPFLIEAAEREAALRTLLQGMGSPRRTPFPKW